MILSAASILVTSALSAPCPVLPEPEAGSWWCPQVYRVSGSAGPDRAVNILFLSDGFLAEDLERYRCAVHRLSEGVLGSSLFSRYACRMNVFRMDLAAPPSRSGVETHAGCKVKCAPGRRVDDASWRCSPEETAAAPVGPRDRPACATADIDAQVCRAIPTRCDVVWPGAEGLMRASRLSTCAPRTHVVVIIANTKDYAGAGLAGDDPGVAVVTLADMDMDERWTLLAHELGHALFFLLDEGTYGASKAAYAGGRNVVSEQEKAAGEVPWKKRYTSSRVYCNDPECCAGDDDPPEGYVGLVQGAFYDECAYYRSEATCRMSNVASPFCAGCGLYVDSLVKKLELEPCPARAGSPESDAPSPGERR